MNVSDSKQPALRKHTAQAALHLAYERLPNFRQDVSFSPHCD